MTPEEKLQGLLRLKQHEKPPADYFENFLEEFHQRQRQSLMQQGALSLFWERFTTWADGLRRPVVIWSAAGAYAAIMLLVCLWPKPGASPTSATVLITQPPALPVAPAQPAPPMPRNAIPVSNGAAPNLHPSGAKQKGLDDNSVEPEPAPALRPLPKIKEL